MVEILELIDNVCGHNGSHNSNVNKDITTHLAGGGRHTNKMLTCSWLINMWNIAFSF